MICVMLARLARRTVWHVWPVSQALRHRSDTSVALVDMVTTYQTEAGDAFDLSDAKAASDSLLRKLSAFYDGVANGSVSEARANIVIQDLARILVPLNFNRSDRFRHDPALTIPPLPALDLASKISATPADLQGFGRTQLVRGQNHVVAGMRSAETLISRATGV